MNKRIKGIVVGIVLALPLVGWQTPVRAAEADMLTCAPKSGSIEGGKFSLKAGELIQFSCTVTNQGESFSGMLLGKQFLGEQAQGASSSDVKIDKGGKSDASLQFPAVSSSGNYRFTFVVMDYKTKAATSKEVSLTGVLGGEAQPSITNASIADGKYEWSAPFALTLALTLPQGKTLDPKAVSFDAVMVDQAGQSCGTVVNGQAVTQDTDTYKLKFPERGSCVNNALLVILKNATGTAIDKKTLAVNITLPANTQAQVQEPAQVQTSTSMEAPASSGLKTVMIALIATALLVLALAGYFVLRRKR